RAQLDEDERVAKAAAEDWLDVGVAVVAADEGVPFAAPDSTVDHIAHHDPARVLRDVKADRKLLQMIAWLDKYEDGSAYGFAQTVLKIRAERFDDRPGWREEWRP
ncbi:MAG TPA: DUF6221 family protein, partial [Streptosporangiaceae bacterium]